MKLRTLAITIAIAVALAWRVGAQIYDTNNEVVQTFAGSGFAGYTNGVGQQTMFNSPSQVVADSSSNLFVWDGGIQYGGIPVATYIREITPNATVTTALAFSLSGPGMAIDRNNTIWLCPPDTGYLYSFSTNGLIPIRLSISGTGNSQAVCVDSQGNVYISDLTHIYRYDTNGGLNVFAGSGNLGAVNGNGIFTSFNTPTVLAADAADNIYVWDSGNYLIRKIDQSQNVVTFAGRYQNPASVDGNGTNAGFAAVYQMCFDVSGNMLLACGACVRKISAATNVTTIAGSFTQSSYANGAGDLARFSGASGICVSQGMMFVADANNERIRNIAFNPPPQIVSAGNLGIATYAGLTITGVVGRTYQVQTSPDMTNWTTHATLLLTASPYLWFDQNPIGGSKFYRALLLP